MPRPSVGGKLEMHLLSFQIDVGLYGISLGGWELLACRWVWVCWLTAVYSVMLFVTLYGLFPPPPRLFTVVVQLLWMIDIYCSDLKIPGNPWKCTDSIVDV